MVTESYGRRENRVILALGYTDLRLEIDGLNRVVNQLDPFEPGVLFLFCGRRADRIKGLPWKRTGFLLLYKRLEDGSFCWPRTTEETRELTREEYVLLMRGLYPLERIHEAHPRGII